MLTHGKVVGEFKSLEQRVGIKVEAIPDHSSSTRFQKESEKPDYWQLFLTPNGSDTGIYVGIIYNAIYGHSPVMDSNGSIHALINNSHPKTCDVPQEDLHLVWSALMGLTIGEVYWEDKIDDRQKIIFASY